MILRGRSAAVLVTIMFGTFSTLGSGAAADSSYLARLAIVVHDRLEAASLAHAPKLVPPVPIVVRWKPVRIGSFDLGAPLVALVAGDLDGDGRGELYAVTSREVIAFSVIGGKSAELGRVAFSGEPALPTPRDVIGVATVDGDAVIASVSTFAKSIRVHWRGKALVGEAGPVGFTTCPRETLQLVPGRNYLGDAATAIYGARCRDLVDPEGHPLHARATLATSNKLAVAVERCPSGAACQPAVSHEYPAVGVAFELADVDRDGKPEVIVSGAGAPGDTDAVKIMTFPDEKPVFRKAFTGGVVGIAAVDDGPTGGVGVIAAVRLVGATRVDLWRLD